jgi:hypothetical protein
MKKNTEIVDEEVIGEHPAKGTSRTAGLPFGWTRTTLVIREDLLDALKSVAWWNRSTVKDVTEKLFEEYISSAEVKSVLSKINSLKKEK